MRSSFRYHGRIAAEDFFMPRGPKSIVSLYEGFRASGKSWTSITLPTRMSTLRNSSQVRAIGGTSMRVALDHPQPEAAAQALVLPLGDPLDPQVVRDVPLRDAHGLRTLHRDLVRLDLRGPIDVRVAPVPEGPALPPLADMNEFMNHVEIENPGLARLQVVESRDDVAVGIIDVHVHVLCDRFDVAFREDLLAGPVVREESFEAGVNVEAREDIPPLIPPPP